MPQEKLPKTRKEAENMQIIVITTTPETKGCAEDGCGLALWRDRIRCQYHSCQDNARCDTPSGGFYYCSEHRAFHNARIAALRA